MNTVLANLTAGLFMRDINPTIPPGFEKVWDVLDAVSGLAIIIGFIGLFIIAIRLFINNRRGEATEQAMTLGWVAVGLILIGSAAKIVGWFVTIPS